ncbi:type VII secretion integral membrane protein EccD [Rhodococcus sp. X156]|uniref:type VII secretion integral membrane protein EccD n=1 Tax=Rhodococcus sp. X156 TaxID=2499145 RepID=UPI0019D1EF10|nr:type VII secretion integral membrane protein EccD [Rhodococcus sp. X156]
MTAVAPAPGSTVSPTPPGAPAATGAAYTRTTVLAPRTRIDVALPSDVAVADLLPMLLDMGRATTADGGAPHGGWCLARVAQGPLDATRTLAAQGVLDGELLQLRKRSESPPPPLYDDVIDAVALSAPDGYRPWTAQTARALGAGTTLLALLAATVALYLAGPGTGEAIAAAGAAAVLVAVAAVVARVYRDRRSAVVIGVGALPLGALAGLFAVPGELGRPHLLLACVVAAVLATAALALTATGVTPFVAVVVAGLLGAGASVVAVLVAHPQWGIGAGMAAAALVGLSVAPRLTIHLARLPLPSVPISAQELNQDDDTEFPDGASIERQAALGHQYLSGLVIGLGVTAGAGALLAAEQGRFGVAFAIVVAAVLMLRARTYANGTQAVSLLLAGTATSAGLVVGWLCTGEQRTLGTWVFATCLLLAAAALVLGVVFPRQRFSPVLRRTVELVEAVLIAVVLPLALAVMDLYSTMRHL